MCNQQFFTYVVLCVTCAICPTLGQDKPVPDQLVNFDPSKLIRFADSKQAEEKRKQLIKYVWQKGLPTDRMPIAKPKPKDVFGGPLSGIDPVNARSVMELRCEVMPYKYATTCFLIQSNIKNRNNRRLLVVHSGHRGGKEIGEGVDRTIETGLAKGFQILLADMPLVGWNLDREFNIPPTTTRKSRTIRISNRGSGGHNEMFRQLGPPVLPQGTVFRFFAEPIVQGINHFMKSTQDPIDVSMVGLSGGGWATHFCAAIDTRIRNSFPVAGAMPLYARKFSRGSWGDAEQTHAPLYGEEDSDSDGINDKAAGVASWLEIFALGGIGLDRHQLQILNLKDPCCFSTEVYRTYDSFLTEKVKQVGKGQWSLFSDRTHAKHIISDAAIKRVMDVLE